MWLFSNQKQKMAINWKDKPPYDHAGRWKKNIKSIMNPGAEVTWPQFICEMVIFNRTRFVKDFPKILRGKGWSNQIQSQVRSVVQQAHNICNYFPHPDDDPMVFVATKNFFRNNGCCKLGGFKKNRVSKAGKCLVSQAEKDVVKGITSEYDKLSRRRSAFVDTAPKQNIERDTGKIQYRLVTNAKKGKMSSLIDLEKKLEDKQE